MKLLLMRGRKTPRDQVLDLMQTQRYRSLPDQLEALTLALNEVGRRQGWIWKQQRSAHPLRTALMLLDGTKNFGCCTDFSGALVELATAAPPRGLGLPGGRHGVHKRKTRGKFGKGLIVGPTDKAIDAYFHGNVITRTKPTNRTNEEPGYKVTGLAQFSNHVYVVQPNSTRVYDPSVGLIFHQLNDMINVHVKVPSFNSRKAATGIDGNGRRVRSSPVVSRKRLVSPPEQFEVDYQKNDKRFDVRRSSYHLWDLQPMPAA